ncbi:gp58-like family protein [Streptococcus phocae subsp. phocae]
MSRDPTTTINEENVTISPDGRFFYTFTPRQNTNSVRLASDCLGNAKFSQIMIEKGDKATNYVAPFVIEGSGESTGIFKGLEEALNSIKEINLEMTDTENSNLWSKIKINNRGMLRTYFDTTIKNEILETARGIRETISDTERGLKSEFTKTVQGQRVKLESLLEQKTAEMGVTVNGLRLSINQANEKTAVIQASVAGLRQDYKDADKQLSASFQSGIEGLKTTIRDEKLGLQAEIASSARGLSQKYDDELRKLSAKITTTSDGTTEAYENKLDGLRAEFTRSNQGMRTEFESKFSGLQSTYQATANQISQEIKNREGAISRIQLDINSYQRKLQDANDNYSSLQQTVRGLQSTVSDSKERLESRISQLSNQITSKVTKGEVGTIIAQNYDNIAFAIKDKLPVNKMSGKDIVTAINLERNYGVRIKGENISLDGNSYISNAIIKDAHIANMDAGKINTGYLSGSRIAAEAITGDKIKMDYAFFNKLTANEGYFRSLFAKDIFATSVQSVALSASKITGGVLSATNGASQWNLNTANMTFNKDATINFNTQYNAIVRKRGQSTAFLHFNDDVYGGAFVGLGVTSNYEGIKSQDTVRFAGVRVFRSNDQNDQLELYGDKIILSHGFGQGGSLILKFSDFGGKDVNLATILDMIFDNFNNLNVNGNYSRNFYGSWK